jgi:ABC-2 type transport system ATP-binding protein
LRILEYATMQHAIETEGLTKVFRKGWSKKEFRAVDGISLRIEPGAIFGLLGPNGAGKTTFVKMLLSCSHATAGFARVFGEDTRIRRAREPIGYLPENHRFPTYMTGRGMLDFYGALSGMDDSTRKRRIPELLELVGLSKWGGVRLGKYSKGMLQRVGLAQALMHEPRLLVLDEPSDGVDPVGRRQIRDILEALQKKGVTIFLNSHLLVEVELFCRDVAIIHQGKVALEGKVSDLTAGSGYKVEAEQVPDNLAAELHAGSKSIAHDNGTFAVLFDDRDAANRAVDLLRARQCPIEKFGRVNSTLEDVFMRTVSGK